MDASALELSAWVSRVHAIDLSSEMLRIATDKAAEANVTKVTFHHTTLDNVPFERATFDAVCAYNVLHLLEDRRGALNAIFLLLKPGGVFISTTACLGESLVPFRLVLPIMRWVRRAPAVQVLRVHKLEDDFLEAGFEEVQRTKVSSQKTNAFLIAASPAE